jgi:hypothetical protein
MLYFEVKVARFQSLFIASGHFLKKHFLSFYLWFVKSAFHSSKIKNKKQCLAFYIMFRRC